MAPATESPLVSKISISTSTSVPPLILVRLHWKSFPSSGADTSVISPAFSFGAANDEPTIAAKALSQTEPISSTSWCDPFFAIKGSSHAFRKNSSGIFCRNLTAYHPCPHRPPPGGEPIAPGPRYPCAPPHRAAPRGRPSETPSKEGRSQDDAAKMMDVSRSHTDDGLCLTLPDTRQALCATAI